MSKLKSEEQTAYFTRGIERLKYATTPAGSQGLGEYCRVHKRDLTALLDDWARIDEAFRKAHVFLSPKDYDDAALGRASIAARALLDEAEKRGILKSAGGAVSVKDHEALKAKYDALLKESLK